MAATKQDPLTAAAENILTAAEQARALVATLDAATPPNLLVPWSSDINQLRHALAPLTGHGRQPHQTLESVARQVIRDQQEKENTP